MEKLVSQFEKVFINKKVLNSTLAQRVMNLFPQSKIFLVDELPYEENGTLTAVEFEQSKRQLYLCEFKGSFFKRCPGARPGLTCCNYFVLNLGLQCNMNCSYCYLQSFINTRALTLYTNIDKALEELKVIANDNKDLVVRVGTGETIDSLSLDPITLYSQKLIHFFNQFPNWKLEFKTKSDFVDQFVHCEHIGNTIVSWSLNPQHIIEKEEHGTASLKDRLLAAKKCLDNGFLLSFHIDPVIWHPNWEMNYKLLVDQITDLFSPKDLYTISIGALRFQPSQRFMMKERFGFESYVNQAELFNSTDGKLRYDYNLRKKMFSTIVDYFKNKNPNWSIFLCMETPETWLASMKGLPKKHLELNTLFDHRTVSKVRESLKNI